MATTKNSVSFYVYNNGIWEISSSASVSPVTTAAKICGEIIDRIKIVDCDPQKFILFLKRHFTKRKNDGKRDDEKNIKSEGHLWCLKCQIDLFK